MKEGSLFCSYEIHQTQMLRVFGVFGKLWMRRDGWAFGSMAFGLAEQKFLNIE
jgi:hypothetical protein